MVGDAALNTNHRQNIRIRKQSNFIKSQLLNIILSIYFRCINIIDIQIMKKKLIHFVYFLYFLFCSFCSFAQRPFYEWAKGAGTGDRTDVADCITTDIEGNVYIGGTFQNRTITFGNITLFKTTPNDNIRNVFLVKYDSKGNVKWAKSAKGSDFDDNANGITTDALGNVYMVGSFGSNSITFDSITLHGKGLYIVKYDSNGNVLWAKTSTSRLQDAYISAVTDSSGNVYVVGDFNSDSLMFDSIKIYNHSIVNNFNLVLVKYDSEGHVKWAKSTGGNKRDVTTCISIDKIENNIYVVGNFESDSIQFDNYTLKKDTAEIANAFIAKYNSYGKVIWAKSINGDESNGTNKISVDNSGDLFFSGTFSSNSLTFDSVTLIRNPKSYYDIFILKCNKDGKIIWSKTIGNEGGQYSVYDIVPDNMGNVLINGYFNTSNLVVDSLDIKHTVGIYYSYTYLLKLDHHGIANWAINSCDWGYAESYSLTIDSSNNIYIAGAGYGIFGRDTLTQNLFVAKLSYPIALVNEIKSNKNQIKIYPNPFHNSITFDFDNVSLKNVELSI